MADMVPVGNTGRSSTVDPFAPLNNILGLQSKMQELQSQGLALQQQQNFSQFQKNFDVTKYMNKDTGVLDANAAMQGDEFQKAGNAQELAQQYIQRIQTGQLQSKTALNSLNDDALTNMYQRSYALSNDPDVIADNEQGRQKVRDHFTALKQQYPTASGLFDHFAQVADEQKGAPKNKLSEALYYQAAQGWDTANARDQFNVQRGTNAAGQATTASTRTGTVGLAPIAPGQKAADVNPPSPIIAGQAARAGGAADADFSTNKVVIAAQKSAPANIDLANRIDQLADIVHSGTIPAAIRSGLAALGVTDVASAQDELKKSIGAFQANLADRAGSDSRAAAALSQLPSSTASTTAIHAQMDLQRGYARQDMALGKLRDRNEARTGGNMTGFQGEYSHAVSAASPLIHEYLAQPNAAAKGKFLTRQFTDRASAQRFRDQANAIQLHSSNVLGNQ